MTYLFPVAGGLLALFAVAFAASRSEVVLRGLWGVLSALLNTRNLDRAIASHGIIAFVGPNGSGKSLAAVNYLRPTLEGQSYHCEQIEHRHHAATLRHAKGCARCLPPTDARMCDAGQRMADNDEWLEHEPECDYCRPGDPWQLCARGRGLLEHYSDGVRRVYSTVPLLDGDGRPHRLYVAVSSDTGGYRQLLQVEHADLFLDEVAGVSDSSDSATMPVQFTNHLHKLRKVDVNLFITTPALSRASKPIRQVVQVVVDCRGKLPEASSGRRWRPNRAFIYRAYSALDFEDFKRTTGSRVRSIARGAFWRPGSWAQDAYDSLGAVGELMERTEQGMCLVCGGSQGQRPKCGCRPGDDLIPLEDLVVVTVTEGRDRRRVPQRRSDEAAAVVGSLNKNDGPDPARSDPSPLLTQSRLRGGSDTHSN